MYLDRPIGIDLGTTNSAVALLEPDGRDLLIYTDRFRRRVVPSVVAWDPGAEEVLVGFKAWNRRGLEPEPISSIKRKMGQQSAVAVGPHEMTPEQVSAEILKAVRAGMVEYTTSKVEAGIGLELGRAVITVPAYFDAPQIEATRRAGELAGLEVLSLLQEPTAAAMYYAWKHGLQDGTFMVYDLGGGTFDVSIIRCLMGEYQVLGIHGDNYLGGDDFDRRFAEHLRKHLVKEGYALELNLQESQEDQVRFLILTRIAQEVKEALSASEFQYVGRRDIFKDHEGNPVTLELEVSRGEWEGLMRSYVEQTIACCHKAMEGATELAGIGLGDVDHVLLVGGSTRVPMVQQMVAEAFCGAGLMKADRPLQDEPETCVALGAAIHAANLGGLTLGDRENAVGVNILSPLTTRRDKARLTGRVVGAAAGAVGRVELEEDLGGEMQAAGGSEVEGGRFKISDIALPDPGTYTYRLSLYGGESGGDAVVSFPIALYRGSDVRSTGSALSNPSVLAKDIYLEVVKLGRPDRKKLLDKGTSLPHEARFRFFTADQSGAVILRLLQNRLPIRTIHLEVPSETPVGTPVDLVLKVDETMAMVAEGGVGEQVFWAQIEAAAGREDKNWEQIEALLDDADGISAQLWGHEASYVRSQVDYLKAGIREAAQTDPDKLQVLVGRLEDLLESYRSGDHQLVPTYDRFQWVVNQVRRRVFRNADQERPLGLDADAWTQRLSEVELQGADAYGRRDQDTWGRVYSQIQAIWESLAQDDYRFSDPNTPEALVRRIHSARSHVDQIKENLAVLVLSENEETRKLQQAEKLAILDALNTEAIEPLDALGHDPEANAATRTKLEKIHSALHRLERRLERLPSLGLVSGS